MKDTTQETKMTIWEALAKAQGEMTEPAKNEQGYNYSYAPLDTVVKITRPVLAKYGLFIMQFPINLDDKVGIKTVVGHESGDKIEETFVMPLSNIVAKGNAAQQIGAAITYLRRYALMAVCGLAPEDDDAQSLPRGEARQSNGHIAKVTEKQLKFINTLISNTESDRAVIHSFYHVESLKDLSSEQASDLIKKLQAKQEPMYEESIQ